MAHGPIQPGKYTVYVVSSPVDRLRYVAGDIATAEVEFLPSDKPVAETPLDPVIPVLAVGIVGVLGLGLSRLHGKKEL
jgi:hypothetical protein